MKTVDGDMYHKVYDFKIKHCAFVLLALGFAVLIYFATTPEDTSRITKQLFLKQRVSSSCYHIKAITCEHCICVF